MKFIEYEILIIRVVICLVSLAGCVWHVSDISQIYFSYKTNVNVRFEREVMIQMPAITLCTNTSFVARQQYLMQKFPNHLNETAQKWAFGKYLRKLSLKEQLLNATISPQQFFNSCSVMKPIAFEEKYDIDYIGCENVSQYQQYIDYHRKCFTIFSQLHNENNDNYIVDHDIILRDNGFPLYKIVLNNDYLQDLVVFIHSRSTPFLGFIGGQTNGMHLNNTKHVSYTLSYVKTTTRLLPSPYETSCLDYNTIGYKTQSHCIIICKAHYFIENFNGWHLDIPFSDEYSSDIQFSDNQWRENKTVDKLMANQCLKTCGKKENCFNEYLTMNIIGQFEREVNKHDEWYGIFFHLPTGLNTKYIHSPRLHLVEYICYAASVFSLWFGISITTLSKVIIIFYNRLRNKKDDKNEINAEINSANNMNTEYRF